MVWVGTAASTEIGPAEDHDSAAWGQRVPILNQIHALESPDSTRVLCCFRRRQKNLSGASKLIVIVLKQGSTVLIPAERYRPKLTEFGEANSPACLFHRLTPTSSQFDRGAKHASGRSALRRQDHSSHS